MAKRLLHERATLAHLHELIPQLRAGDRDEVLAADGEVWCGVYNAFRLSVDPIAMRDKSGGLIAVYGASPGSLLHGSSAAPWLLGTERMRVNALSVYHDMRMYLRFLGEHYDSLLNYVDARNVESVRWLSSLGFDIGDAEKRGPFNMLFHPFSMDFR